VDGVELAVRVDLDAPGLARLVLAGEVDAATRPRLDEAFAAAIAAGHREVHVDAEAVTFLDSSGVAAIVDAIGAGATVEVHHPRPMVRRVLRLLAVQGLTIAD
jgi:anti-sigma B factor antagonist